LAASSEEGDASIEQPQDSVEIEDEETPLAARTTDEQKKGVFTTWIAAVGAAILGKGMYNHDKKAHEKKAKIDREKK
jgi:uncharacterized protein HemX